MTTKPQPPEIVTYAVLRTEDGLYVPAKVRIRNNMVRSTEHIVEPCPYLALAYQALEAAIAQEYLASTLRKPAPPKAPPREDK